MSNVTVQDKNMAAVELALVRNDISKLSSDEKMSYYNALCESVGLNPLAKPFAFLTLQGRETIYATKDCSEHLRKIHGVSTQIISKGIVGDMYEVHIKAKDKYGREDEDISIIPLGLTKGNDLANLMMKAVTKAKRRVTLSICGLGLLDESELETIPREDKGFAENPQIEHPLYPKEKKTAFDEMDEVINSDFGSYVCNVGKKYAGKMLSEIGQVDLRKYLDWLETSAREKNQEITGDWLEFRNNAEAFLKSLEG